MGAKNQGEGGGHCVFGDDISEQLRQLKPEEYDAWALMQRFCTWHERDVPTIAVRDTQQTLVTDLSQRGRPIHRLLQRWTSNRTGRLCWLRIRSKPAASENEGGSTAVKGILDSLVLID